MDPVLAQKIEKNLIARDANKFNICNALDLVKKYIQDNNLVLYGGQALHFAICLKDNIGIYEPDSIPDYDFLVSDPWQDSINLANIVLKNGLEEVSCINALHLTTRRVRVNFITVADLSYCPPEILKIIPKLRYQGFQVVHPDWQRLDFHRELTHLFENPPNEVVKFRTKKTLFRFAKITQLYPIKPKTEIMKQTLDLWKAGKTFTLKPLDLFPASTYEKSCISGLHAYACYYSIVKQAIYTQKSLLARDNMDKRCDYLITRICPAEISWKTMQVQVPKNLPRRFNILSDEFLKISPRNYKKHELYDRFLDDICPRKSRYIADWILDIYDNKGTYTPASTIENLAAYCSELNVFFPTEFKTHIAGAQVLLLDFLAQYFLSKKQNPELAEIWLYLYTSVEALVVLAEQIYKSTENENWLKMPLFLGTDYYGSENWYLSQIYNAWKTEMLVYTGSNKDLMNLRPPNYYPTLDNMEPREWENTEDNWIFSWNGGKRDELKPMESSIVETRPEMKKIPNTLNKKIEKNKN